MLGLILFAAATAADAAPACAFDPETGALQHSTEATPQFEAGKDPAFSGASFEFGGASYVKFGAPIQMAPMEVQAFGEKGTVPLFIGSDGYDDTIFYVMVSSAECVFQRYELDQ